MSKSPFTKKELEEFKQLLLEKKARLLKEVQEQQATAVNKPDEPGDVVDMATELLDQELNLSLTTAEIETLNEINDALERIEKGSYGVCIDSGEPINKVRLKALPEAKRTLEAQEKFDKIQKEKKKRSGA